MAALDVVLHRMAVSVPTRVQQPTRGVRHHVAGIVVRQLELTVGVQPGDAVERQGLGCRKQLCHLVAVIVRHHVVECPEGFYAIKVTDGIKSHGACRIALRQFRKRGKNAWTFLLHFCQSLFKMDTLEDGWIRINYPIQYYWQVQAVCL